MALVAAATPEDDRHLPLMCIFTRSNGSNQSPQMVLMHLPVRDVPKPNNRPAGFSGPSFDPR